MWLNNNAIDEKILIRMPRELKEKIYLFAKLNYRSMNAEILFRLKQTVMSECASIEALENKQR